MLYSAMQQAQEDTDNLIQQGGEADSQLRMALLTSMIKKPKTLSPFHAKALSSSHPRRPLAQPVDAQLQAQRNPSSHSLWLLLNQLTDSIHGNSRLSLT